MIMRIVSFPAKIVQPRFGRTIIPTANLHDSLWVEVCWVVHIPTESGHLGFSQTLDQRINLRIHEID
jgi:hypothetical protein